jgi:hypothetical protein
VVGEVVVLEAVPNRTPRGHFEYSWDLEANEPSGVSGDPTTQERTDEPRLEFVYDEPGEYLVELTVDMGDEELTVTEELTVVEDAEEAEQAEEDDEGEADEEPEEEEPGYFDVTIQGTDSPVTEGDDLTVDAYVENTGDEETTQQVELTDVDGNSQDSQEVTLAGGDATEISLIWSTEEGDAGSGDVTVASDDTSDAASVTVEEAEEKAEDPGFEIRFDPSTPAVDEWITCELEPNETLEARVEEYQWDIDGDGEVDETTDEPTLEWRYTEPSDWTLIVTAVLEDGSTVSETQTVTVEEE